jgi:hypothetical protein
MNKQAAIPVADEGPDAVAAPMLHASRREAETGTLVRPDCVWRRDGEWSGWRVQRGTLSIRLAPSDPSPLFAADRDGDITLSQNLLQMLDCVGDLTLDTEAISIFLHLGFFLGDRTPFRAIRAVQAGECGTLDASGLRWERPHAAPPAECTLDLAGVTDAFIEAMRRAIASAEVPERFVHPLSGGRDSRYMLFELKRQGRVPSECVTLAETLEHPDAVVARRVASALGVPHRVLRPYGLGFDRELVNVDATHLCADEHSWFVPLAAELRRVTPVVFDGLGGGVLFRATFADDPALAGASAEKCANAVLEIFRAPSPAALEAAGSLLGCRLLTRAEVIDRVTAAMKGLAGEPNPFTRFIFESRTCREIALVPRSMYRAIAAIHTPFLHPEVMALARSLPARFFAANPRFEDHATRVAFREAASLPYVEKDAVYPKRRRRASGALSRARRTLFWRRHLAPSDRRIARQLRGILKPNRLRWLLMLKAAASSPGARREILARAEQVLGRVQTGAAARA